MYRLLKSVLSDKAKNRIWNATKSLIKNKLVDMDNRVPKYPLQPKHFANLKAVSNRVELLQLMPKKAVVAELGVNKGDFSEKILEITDAAKLHLVDAWDSKRYHTGLKLDIENRFKNYFDQGMLEINYGYSTEVVIDFPDNYFDWIYIDTEHTYHTTIAELNAYESKMKKGGIIAGHDFVMGNWKGLTRYGVIEAVYEFCNKRNWEIIYITMDLEEFQSFAIRKIAD